MPGPVTGWCGATTPGAGRASARASQPGDRLRAVTGAYCGHPGLPGRWSSVWAMSASGTCAPGPSIQSPRVFAHDATRSSVLPESTSGDARRAPRPEPVRGLLQHDVRVRPAEAER